MTTQYLRAVPGVDLKKLRRELKDSRPDVSTFKPGWGTVDDDFSNVGAPADAPERSDVPLLRSGGGFSQRVFARLYYWVPVQGAERIIASGADLLLSRRLQVCDFMFVERSKGQMLIVCSTRNARDLNQVVLPAVKALLGKIDDSVEVTKGHPDLEVGDPDIYLWLLARQHSGAPIDPSLTLAEIRHMHCRDAHMRTASLEREVDVSRRELLALVTNPTATFGPAKLKVDYAPSEARIDFELHADGGFAVHSEWTHYRDIVDRTDVRIQAMQELVFTVVPIIKNAYQGDTEWQESGRAAFIAECAAALAAS